jgi:hypothetical protein
LIQWIFAMDRWIRSSPHHSLAYTREDKGSNASTSFEVLIPGLCEHAFHSVRWMRHCAFFSFCVL